MPYKFKYIGEEYKSQYFFIKKSKVILKKVFEYILFLILQFLPY